MKVLLQKIKNYLSVTRNRKRIIFLTVVISTSLWLFWGIPLPTKLSSPDFPVSTRLLDRNGKLIYEIYTDKRRSPIKLEELPDHVKKSTIAIEDKDFYKHSLKQSKNDSV